MNSCPRVPARKQSTKVKHIFLAGIKSQISRLNPFATVAKMPFTKIRSRMKDKFHSRHKHDGQSTDADETASVLSDDSLTLTVVRHFAHFGNSWWLQRRLYRRYRRHLLSCLVCFCQMDSQMDSQSTASTADMDALAGENGMDDLAGDTDAASFRYVRLVIYSARNVLCKDYSGFSDP